jgi:hypothetical protein
MGDPCERRVSSKAKTEEKQRRLAFLVLGHWKRSGWFFGRRCVLLALLLIREKLEREAGERSIRLSFDVSEETKRRKDARRLPIKAVARLVRERVWLSAGVDGVGLIIRPFRHLDRTRVLRGGAFVDVMNWQGFAVDVDEGVLTPTVRELAVESRKTERRLGQYRKENRLKRSGGRTDDEREAEA